jgi:hypothetical protein
MPPGRPTSVTSIDETNYAERATRWPVSLGAETCVLTSVAIAALKKARLNWQAASEVSSMESLRATLEADLAVAPLLSDSMPESLEIINADRRLPSLPMFRINLYVAQRPSPAAIAIADHVRRSVASGETDCAGSWTNSAGSPGSAGGASHVGTVARAFRPEFGFVIAPSILQQDPREAPHEAPGRAHHIAA